MLNFLFKKVSAESSALTRMLFMNSLCFYFFNMVAFIAL